MPSISFPRRLARLPIIALPALLAVALAARSRRAAPHERTLELVATEFAFAAPDTVVAGRTRVRLTSRGTEPHIVEIVRLPDGRTPGELVAELEARRLPSWATFVGGPLVPPRDGASEVTVELAPGRYALICPIPSPADHKSHMTKGMVHTLVVVPPPPRAARPDAADRREARIVLDDYGFVLEPWWTPGAYRFRVENRAAQPHEAVVFKLAPGKHVADVLRWVREPAGPPPGEFVGGTTSVSRGQTAEFEAALVPGDYALLCFALDATDGRSHIAHGMTRELTVK